mgnify:CR=1 FL=1
MSPKIKFIKKVLEIFDKENIKYAILRNYEFLLQPGPTESMDTIIAREDLGKAERILFRLGFNKRKPQFSLKHKAYFKYVGLEAVSFDIQAGGVYWNDMKYMDESILERRMKNSFFYILSPDDYVTMLITHSILGKRHFKPKYQRIISETQYDQEAVIKNLGLIFNKSYAEKILSLVQKGEFQAIPIKSLLANFLSRPSNLIIFIPLTFRWIAWKKPLGAYPLICFIGPDGAGKSTMAKELQEHLCNTKRKTSIIYVGRGKGYVLPIYKVGRKYKENERNKTLKNSTVNYLKRDLAYTSAAVIFTLDLALRYLFSIFLKRRMRCIVITDRYCSDIYLMKHVPKSMRFFLLNLFPKPTVTFYLYNNLEALLERRPYESLAGLQRQLSLFAELCPKLNAIPLKTDDYRRTKEKVITEVNRYLLTNWY